jgi:uroporphyrinogen III methyltransferase/synthase
MPLHGKTILTTRAAAHAGDLNARLIGLGARVIDCPAIEITPVDDWNAVDDAIASLDSYQWLLFTSGNAVDIFLQRAGLLKAESYPPIAVVGPATAAALDRWGVKATLVAADFRAEGLMAAFPLNLGGTRILFPRAEAAREILPQELRRRGATVDIVVVYRTIKGQGMEKIRAILSETNIDCVVFTSSSTVRFMAEALGEDLAMLQKTAVAVIGPITRSAAEAIGLHPAIEPQAATAADLAEAIQNYFNTS